MLFKITKIHYKTPKVCSFQCEGIDVRHKWVNVKTFSTTDIKNIVVGNTFLPLWAPFSEKYIDKNGEEKKATFMIAYEFDWRNIYKTEEATIAKPTVEQRLQDSWKQYDDTENLIDWGDK